MNISVLGLIFGLALLIIPIYIIIAFDLPILRKFMVTTAKMICFVAVAGGMTFLLMQWNNIAFNILGGIVISLFTAIVIVKRARLNLSKLIIPVASGVVLTLFVVGLLMLFLVLELKTPFQTQYFIPVFGLIAGGIIGVNANALHTYYMGLKHHNKLYYFLLGNGSTHPEAVRYFQRRAFQAALTPAMRQMADVVIFSAPVAMLVLIMAGVNIFTAIALQIIFVLMVTSASVTSLYISFLFAKRYSFDEYEALRPITQNGPVAPQQEEPAQTSDFSSNPSVPPHTDSESLPQE